MSCSYYCNQLFSCFSIFQQTTKSVTVSTVSEKKFKTNELSHMDVIFAAINKFLRFLSGFSHTHRFCYQPVNLCLSHYEIRFPWMKCWLKWVENHAAEKLVFLSSAFPSTSSRIFSSPPLLFRISYHGVYLKLGRSRQCPWRAFFLTVEGTLLLDKGGLKSAKCSRSSGIVAVFSSSSRTSVQLAQLHSQFLCNSKKKKASMISPVMFESIS